MTRAGALDEAGHVTCCTLDRYEVGNWQLHPSTHHVSCQLLPRDMMPSVNVALCLSTCFLLTVKSFRFVIPSVPSLVLLPLTCFPQISAIVSELTFVEDVEMEMSFRFLW